MGNAILPPYSRIGFKRETIFRNGDAPLTTIYAFDITKRFEKEVEMPHSKINIRKIHTYGSRNVGAIVNLGFKAGESTFDYDLLTGIFLAYVMGGCTTVDTSTYISGTQATAAVASQGGKILTVTTSTPMTANTHKGRALMATVGGAPYYYFIDENSTNTITLTETPTTITGTNYVTVIEYFTHTITEANTIPSFSIYYEYGNGTDAIRQSLLGCMVKSFELAFEAGSDTPCGAKAEIIAAKVVDTVTAIAEPEILPLDVFVRRHFASPGTMALTYNSTNVEENLIDQTNKHSIKISNDIDLKDVFGDEYPKKVLVGKREYEIHYDAYIRNTTWRALSRLRIPTFASQYGTTGFYLTALAMQTKIARGTYDYINFALSKLAMNGEDYKDKLIGWDEKEMLLDLGFFGAPGCVQTAEVRDCIPSTHYPG